LGNQIVLDLLITYKTNKRSLYCKKKKKSPGSFRTQNFLFSQKTAFIESKLSFNILSHYDVMMLFNEIMHLRNQLLHHHIFGPAHWHVSEKRREMQDDWTKNNINTFQRILMLGKCCCFFPTM